MPAQRRSAGRCSEAWALAFPVTDGRRGRASAPKGNARGAGQRAPVRHAGQEVEFLEDASGSVFHENRAGGAHAEEIHRIFSILLLSQYAAVMSTGEWIQPIRAELSAPQPALCRGRWEGNSSAMVEATLKLVAMASDSGGVMLRFHAQAAVLRGISGLRLLGPSSPRGVSG
jgi:hypothetical protein